MSAIAYVTDSKMLELHRLNNNKTMNFWRTSSKINFTDFGTGDLVFFLSKDKEHKNKNEKGIVGFGRVTDITVASVKTMWKKYGTLNGYQSLEEFKEAIIKVSKDKKVPDKISGLYLENVVFFQPVYLSECGMKISTNVESYTYLKDEQVVKQLLELAKNSNDIWSALNNNVQDIEKEEVIYALYSAHNVIGDVVVSDKVYKKGNRILKQYLKEHDEYQFVQNSRNEVYKEEDKVINMVFYYDKNIDQRLLIGQAFLYRNYIKEFCNLDVITEVRFINQNKQLSEYLEY